MSLFSVDLTSLTKELQQLKFSQQLQQNQIIALLQEQNQLLKQLLQK